MILQLITYETVINRILFMKNIILFCVKANAYFLSLKTKKITFGVFTMLKTPSGKQINAPASSRSVSSQVKIYNRHFYLRQTAHDKLQQQYQKQIKRLSNKPKITQNSYNILAKKLQSAISTVLKQNVDNFQESGNITFLQMQKVLKKFIDFPKQDTVEEEGIHCQLWLLISGYDIDKQIKIKTFSSVLRILLDPCNLSVRQMKILIQKIPSLANVDAKRQKFIAKNNQVEEETFTVNRLLALWNQVKICKCVNGFKKQQEMPILRQRQHITFHPKISQNSRVLAQKSLNRYLQANKTKYFSQSRYLDKQNVNNLGSSSPDQLERYLNSTNRQIYSSRNIIEQGSMNPKNLSYHDILYKRSLQNKKYRRVNQENDSFVDNHQRSCTPKISRKVTAQQMKEIVNNLYFVKDSRQSINPKEMKEQNQLKKCTFHPKINAINSLNSLSPRVGVKGFDKTVKRLKQGKQQQDRKKQAYENMGRVKKPSNLKNSRAPSFIERDTPKLILQVKIDHQRIQKIHLKGDEDAHIVAKKFILKHNLANSMLSVLQQLIEQQLYNL